MDFKVRPGDRAGKFKPGPSAKQSASTTGETQASRDFRTFLDQIQYTENQHNPEENIEQLFSQLIEAETGLLERPNEASLHAYRRSIADFLKKVQSESYRVNKFETGSRLNKNTGMIIQTINRKLALVAQGMSTTVEITPEGKKQVTVNPAFNLFSSLREIRGLLLDLKG